MLWLGLGINLFQSPMYKVKCLSFFLYLFYFVLFIMYSCISTLPYQCWFLTWWIDLVICWSFSPAPFPGANGSSLENTRMGLWRRHHHISPRWQYYAQDVTGHSIFNSNVTDPSYRVPTTPNHSKSSSMPIQNAPHRDNMHNFHPPSFRVICHSLLVIPIP